MPIIDSFCPGGGPFVMVLGTPAELPSLAAFEGAISFTFLGSSLPTVSSFLTGEGVLVFQTPAAGGQTYDKTQFFMVF